MANLTVAFRNFATAPIKGWYASLYQTKLRHTLKDGNTHSYYNENSKSSTFTFKLLYF